MKQQKNKVMIVYGTRPECIKLYPIIEALKQYKNIKTFIVNSGQQRQLSDSFTKQFNIKVDKDFKIMKPNQSLNYITSEVVNRLDIQLEIEKPDLVLVQGDTTTAMASALAAFNSKISVGHVEAGLRTYDKYNPYPEESNRRLISQLATYNFCPTINNTDFLYFETRRDKGVWMTGNTSIDVVKTIKPTIKEREHRQILLTLHRRENVESGAALEYVYNISDFIEGSKNIKCTWITHPNSDLKSSYCFKKKLRGLPLQFTFKEPMPYNEFINECYNSDLILSDSGGIQEEITIIKKPLFILRETTERGEVLELPFVKLIKDPNSLLKSLNSFFKSEQVDYSKNKYNIFGKGDSGAKIAKIIATKILK